MQEIINDFLQSKQRNAWLKFRIKKCTLRVYMRKAHHTCGGGPPFTLQSTIDIASVEANPLGTGAFTAFIQIVEEIARERKQTVFVENVFNERLIHFLLARKYLPQDEHSMTPGTSFYLTL